MKFLNFLNRVLPLLFWLLLIFSFDTALFGIMTLLAAIIHELGHFSFGLFSGKLSIFPHPTGLRIKSSTVKSYKAEALLIAGGPIFSFLFALIFYLASSFEILKDYFSLFSVINLLTGLSNLMPIDGYDGYKLCECFLFSHSKNPDKAYRILFYLSFYFTYILLLFSLYLILKIGEGYWIFGVLFSAFILSLKKLTQNGISRE